MNRHVEYIQPYLSGAQACQSDRLPIAKSFCWLRLRHPAGLSPSISLPALYAKQRVLASPGVARLLDDFAPDCFHIVRFIGL